MQQQNIFETKPLTVTEFINQLNSRIRSLNVKVIGEIGRVDEKNGHRYFSLKDENNTGTLNCIIWRSKYEMFGLDLKEGAKVIVSGRPEVYPANGKLSLICDTVELAGSGALKKAYDALLKKLTAEGLFADERKRKLPQFPRVIGVITSKQGAVINDFLTNIGKFGFIIEMIDARVEGQLAVGDILAALRTFRKRKIDVLVIIRGGGSPESLQAFNNEVIVREVVSFPVPVIAGIGHEKDVPLVQMAADVPVSTPSIAAMHLNASWQKVLQLLEQQEVVVIGGYANAMAQARARLKQHAGVLANFKYILQNINSSLDAWQTTMVAALKSGIIDSGRRLDYFAGIISSHDPERQLKLGYSIAKIDGKIIKSTRGAKKGDGLSVTLADGIIDSRVTEVKYHGKQKESR